MKDFNLVIIDNFLNNNNNDLFFVIVFHNAILFVQESSIKLIQHLFKNNLQLKYYFRGNTKDIYDKNNINAKDQIFQSTAKFDEQIVNFGNYIQIDYPNIQIQ